MAGLSNWIISSFRRIPDRIFGERLSGLGLESIAKRGGLNFLGLVVTVFSTFLFQFILGRTVSPAEVGLFNLGYTVSSLIGLLMLAGLDRGVVRYIAHYLGLGDRQRELGVVVVSLRLLLIFTLAVILFFWPLAGVIAERLFRKPELASLLYVFVASLPFLGFTRLTMGILVGYKQIKPMVVIEQILLPVLRILFLVVIILWMTTDVIVISYSHLGTAVIGCVLSAIPLWRLYTSRRQGYSPLLATRELLQFSWPLLIAGLLNRTNTYTETVILGALSSNEQVGFFTVSLKISIVLTIFFEAFNGVWAPYIAEASATGDIAKLAHQFRAVTYWVFSITLPFAIWIFLQAPSLMAIFGPEYVSSASVLRILVLSQLGYVMGGMSALTLIMTGYSRLNLFDLVATVILSLVLDFVLIPKFAANGAAVASAISIVFLTALRSSQVYLLLRIHPFHAGYLKPLLAGVAALLTAIFLNYSFSGWFYLWQFFVIGISILSVYFAFMVILRQDNAVREVV